MRLVPLLHSALYTHICSMYCVNVRFGCNGTIITITSQSTTVAGANQPKMQSNMFVFVILSAQRDEVQCVEVLVSPAKYDQGIMKECSVMIGENQEGHTLIAYVDLRFVLFVVPPSTAYIQTYISTHIFNCIQWNTSLNFKIMSTFVNTLEWVRKNHFTYFVYIRDGQLYACVISVFAVYFTFVFFSHLLCGPGVAKIFETSKLKFKIYWIIVYINNNSQLFVNNTN